MNSRQANPAQSVQSAHVLDLCVSTVVVVGRELVEGGEGGRDRLDVWVRTKVAARGCCGKCGVVSAWFDNGGGERRWRHVDVCFATCELVAEAPRVRCSEHGVTVAAVSWARHGLWFTAAFEDPVVFDAIVSSKPPAARRPPPTASRGARSDHMCVRVATEALGRVDLLDGLVAIAIDDGPTTEGLVVAPMRPEDGEDSRVEISLGLGCPGGSDCRRNR